MPMATKLGRRVTYHEGFLFLTSYGLSIIWSCEATWQIVYDISPFVLDQ